MELVLPWPSAAMSPNGRVHWSTRAKAVKGARSLAWGATLEAGWNEQPLPDGDLHLWWDFYPPTRRLPDDDNMLARCKAYRDGIADALKIDDKRFRSHLYVRNEARKGGEVRVRMTGGTDAANRP